ncbi:MAG: hypothetical protein HY078_04205 [Elusimicrobia bacterium]|nr:hypothetical protein [Elusimicrobiota bacterium]
MTIIALGCAGVQLTGYRQPSDGMKEKHPAVPAEFSVDSSTRPARRRPQDYLPRELTSAQKEAVYYSDLGPDAIDVSGYPPRQRYKYAVYSRACAQCHTLARSINAPTASRAFWEFYITSMRFHAFLRRNVELTKMEREDILEFLEYDGRVRKLEHRSEFDELTDELKRRFTPLMEERLRKMQEGPQPIILRGEPH